MFKSKWILLFVIFGIASCADPLTPSIHFEKSSQDDGKIRNVRVIWNDYHLLKTTEFDECGGGSQTFNIKHDSDFFGPVHVEWENNKGDKLSKDFVFKKSDLPSMSKRHRKDAYVYVNIYFSQNDIEYATSDFPNIKEIDKKYPCDMDKVRKIRLKAIEDEEKAEAAAEKRNRSNGKK